MLSKIRLVAVLAAAGVTACGSLDGTRGGPAAKAPPPAPAPAAGDPDAASYKIGKPYRVEGDSYNPSDNTQYDEVGIASWYGAERAGQPTANGEIFNPAHVSAAHTTLPMPSYAEVTHLETGRTILVRINDRGPFTKGRLIDLSKAAAYQLGLGDQGSAPVRVRRVNPPEADRAALRSGGQAALRIDTPPQLLAALTRKLSEQAPPAPEPAPVAVKPAEPQAKPKPAAKPAPKPPATPAPPVQASAAGWWIQVAALSNRERAEALAKEIGGTSGPSGKYWRVRKGPFATEAVARAALGPIAAKGYRDARVTR
jgi:rare lipoprotein A